jgi:thiamine pyrophosphate-dependent acetolactate synthase large subunit-like protein
MKVHEAIARALVENGVDTMFGIIGDANLFMVDRYTRDHPTTYVPATNEEGAVLMAGGYSATSGRVGVATITHGPALTNTLTALADGVRNGLSILLLVGDTPVVDKYNLQNIDQRELITATGAGFEQVRAPSTVTQDLATALRRARVERRPVALNIPTDFQWTEIDYETVTLSPATVERVAPDPEALDRAVGIIASAHRPIVVAGRGATSPDARAALLRLADRIDAPVATTLKAKDLFRGERFNLDVFGTLSTPVGLDTILASDCVIAFGAGLNRWTTSEGAHLKGRSVVQCDIDPRSIGQYAAVDAGIVGDAALTADTVVSWLDEAGTPPSGFRTAELAARIEEYSPGMYEDLSTDETVDIRTFLTRIEQAMPRDRIVVLDGGRFFLSAVAFLHVTEPRSFINTVNYGSIGLGTGTAIGAAFGAPGRPVLAVCGDGGFMMGGLVEFNTAVRAGADLVVIVCNDGSYGAEHIQFSDRGMDPSLSTFRWPELAPVAEALGGAGITVRTLKDLDAIDDAIRDRDRPLLIDAKLNPNHVPSFGH